MGPHPPAAVRHTLNCPDLKTPNWLWDSLCTLAVQKGVGEIRTTNTRAVGVPTPSPVPGIHHLEVKNHTEHPGEGQTEVCVVREGDGVCPTGHKIALPATERSGSRATVTQVFPPNLLRAGGAHA